MATKLYNGRRLQKPPISYLRKTHCYRFNWSNYDLFSQITIQIWFVHYNWSCWNLKKKENLLIFLFTEDSCLNGSYITVYIPDTSTPWDTNETLRGNQLMLLQVIFSSHLINASTSVSRAIIIGYCPHLRLEEIKKY